MKKSKPILNHEETDINLDLYNCNCPSKITTEYWVYARPVIKKEYKQSSKVGKWLIFVSLNELDQVWQIVKKATEKGVLGIGSKSGTGLWNSNAGDSTDKVICVFTYNWQDKKDVFNVEKSLRKIGINHDLYYKTDEDSRGNKYRINGDTNISKYISKGTKKTYKNSLLSLKGINEGKASILKSIGIKNFDDLLSFSTEKKLKNVGVSTEFINKLKLKALSQIERKILRLSNFEFHDNFEILYFDIETEPYKKHEDRKIWNIVVYHRNKISNFYAKNFDEEKNVLIKFIMYLEEFPNAPLYSYSSYDVNVLNHALKRHSLNVDFFNTRNHFNLYALLKTHFIIPISSYSLKEVGKYFGYKFKSEYINGLDATLEYLRNESSNLEISIELFNYVQDDVKVMDFVIKKIKTKKKIKDIFDYPDENHHVHFLSHKLILKE
jgi:transcription termination factor NusB